MTETEFNALQEHRARWLEYLHNMFSDARSSMKDKSLSKSGVYAFIRHTPTIENEDWGKEIHQISISFLKELYEYSLEMGYIDESTSFEVFVK